MEALAVVIGIVLHVLVMVKVEVLQVTVAAGAVGAFMVIVIQLEEVERPDTMDNVGVDHTMVAVEVPVGEAVMLLRPVVIKDKLDTMVAVEVEVHMAVEVE